MGAARGDSSAFVIPSDHLIASIRRASMWSRFDTVEVELVQRRRARGLTIAGIQRVIMPTDWAER